MSLEQTSYGLTCQRLRTKAIKNSIRNAKSKKFYYLIIYNIFYF